MPQRGYVKWQMGNWEEKKEGEIFHENTLNESYIWDTSSGTSRSNWQILWRGLIARKKIGGAYARMSWFLKAGIF